MVGSGRDTRKPRRCGLLGAATQSGPITLREDRHLAPYKSSRRPFRLSIFPLSSSSYITLRFSLAIHSFPSCRQATRFRWPLHAANQSQTAIPTDLSSNWASSPRNSSFFRSAAAFFNLSTVEEHVILSHDPALLSIRGFLAYPKQSIDLTIDDDKNGQDHDATEVSWLRNTGTAQYCVRLNPTFLIGSF
jgi:hypothetical protein